MNTSNQETIDRSNEIQIQFPSIKSLIVSFKQTRNYKAPTRAKSTLEREIFNRVVKLLEPINEEAIDRAKVYAVERWVILAQPAVELKIANAVVTAAEVPPGDGDGSPKYELRF